MRFSYFPLQFTAKAPFGQTVCKMATEAETPKQDWLSKQDLEKIGVENLNPLTEEVSTNLLLHLLWSLLI